MRLVYEVFAPVWELYQKVSVAAVVAVDVVAAVVLGADGDSMSKRIISRGVAHTWV